MGKELDRSDRIAELSLRHVRDFYVDDPDRALQDFSDDAIFHVYGDNAFTGIWRGKREMGQFYGEALQSFGMRMNPVGEPKIWSAQNIGVAFIRLEVAIPTATAHWDRILLYRFDEDEKIYRTFLYDDDERLFNIFAGLTASDRDRIKTMVRHEPPGEESEARRRNRAMMERRFSEPERLLDVESRKRMAGDHADNVRLHVYGDNSLTGMWMGREKVARLYSEAASSGGVRVEMIGQPRIWAGDTLAAVMFRVRFEGPDGSGEWDHFSILRIDDDGKISEIWYHDDDEDLWDSVARVIGQKHDRSVLQAV